MTQPDADKLSLVLDEDGDEFSFWTDATISDDFLSPCQTMSLSVGVDETRFDVLTKFQIGTRFTVRVNGNPVMSGYLDSAECKRSRSSGVHLTVTGRDILSPAVDSNIDPRMQVAKEMNLVDLAMKVFAEEFHLPIIVFDDDQDDGPAKARNLSLGKPVSSKPRKGKKKARDPMKDLRPHPNEGGFQYFSRFAHRIGFHAWAIPDGSGVVIGTPTWDQEPAYSFKGLRGDTPGRGSMNNIEDSSAKLDYTHVPSHVFVRGKSTKPGDKSQPIGFAEFPPAAYFKPFYVTDAESNDKDHANAVARFTLGKALRTSLDYRITVRGLADPATGRVYTVDTVADVSDEIVGINGNMWVEQRTFRKSRQGTWTDLKLLPANALLMDYYAAESPPPPPANYQAAAASMKPKAKGTRSRNGWDIYVITWDQGSQTQTTQVVDFGDRPFK
jgi:prophage tail gpP-like protein